jgi:cell division protein FtsB
MPRRRRPSASTIALRWLGAAVLIAVALAYVHPLRSYLHARGEVAKRRAEIVALERESRALAQRLARVDDAAFVELEARRLGLVRPGERLFIVKGIEVWNAAQRAGKAKLR